MSLKIFPRAAYVLLYPEFGGGGEAERHYQRSQIAHLDLLMNDKELVSISLNPHLQILNQNNFITVGNILQGATERYYRLLFIFLGPQREQEKNLNLTVLGAIMKTHYFCTSEPQLW